MHHSKVIATIIVCAALIGSILIYNKKVYFFGRQQATLQANVVVDNSNAIDTTDSWRQSLAQFQSATNSPVQIIASQNSTTNDATDNTITAQISKEFFSLYLQDKKNGVTIDQNEAVNIANKTISALNITSEGKQYAVSDIKISQDVSDQKMAQYGQAMLNALHKNLAGTSDPITIIDTASQSKSEADLAALDPIIAGYQNMIRDILKISVPQKAVGYHIVLLNTVSDLLADIQGMRKLLNDPVVGYVSFSAYQKDAVTLGRTIEDMNAAFAK